METEKKLAQYISDTNYDDLPKEPVDTIKNVILTVLGTTIAGASAEGCEALVNQVRDWGGKEEATILIYGGKVPAYNAAFVNSIMARALDFCDAMIPGIHVGSSSIPTALATAELAGGCNGKDFLAALVLGTEIAARINSVSIYDGFDPTGICSIFASTAIAGRILRLNSYQILNALALAFNKAGGSMQSNIDGSLAVRVIQGFVSQGGVICAHLAQRGITGPMNFLEGMYGYFHLYANDKYNPQVVTRDLGERFEMENTLFKKYPSCGGTLSSTEAILELIREKDLNPEDVARIDIKVSPRVYKLVGRQFEIRDNPKVDAQFSIQYCVANAVLRKSSKLYHFDESYIRYSEIMKLAKNIYVSAEPTLEDPERLMLSLGAHMNVTTKKKKVYHKSVDIPKGLPGNPLTKEEHIERFKECVNYANKLLPKVNIEKIVSTVNRLEETKDVCKLIPYLSVK
jgi:2-methylcitrate dehydratase PrpD